MKRRIAVVVPGRWHAFEMTRELIRRGHAVTLFTNYPIRRVTPFGVPVSAVRSLWPEGGLSQINGWVQRKLRWTGFETQLHQWFGCWAAAQLAKQEWDAVVCWSGVAEESFRALERPQKTARLLVRLSSHIRTQARILEEEQARTDLRQERPSPWMIAREEREYRLADCIVVPSGFSYDTFRQRGVSTKIRKNRLGVEVSAFRPEPAAIEARCQRILSGRPLRVLYVGALSFRKGLLDALEIARDLQGENITLRFLGPPAPGTAAHLAELSRFAEIVPKQPQAELPKWYAWGDLFLFPTLEDGYAVVLDQALAGGLPILATAHCAAPDLIQEGVTGWILPIRRPDAFTQRLRWCQGHRKELASMVRNVYAAQPSRDWSDVAAELEQIVEETCQGVRAEPERR